MKKSLVVVLTIVILAVGAFLIFNFMGPNLKEYEKLKEPRFTEMKDQKMIQVEIAGDPTISSGKAIGKLFGVFFKLSANRKEMKMAAPRARWPKDLNTPKEKWIGIFGLPVPVSIKESDLPPDTAPTNSTENVKMSVWKYGKVAEILHIGSYNKETPTIERLLNFIKDNGYTAIGDHEEEYLKGPGPFSFNPKKYYTIIRYRVKK